MGQDSNPVCLCLKCQTCKTRLKEDHRKGSGLVGGPHVQVVGQVTDNRAVERDGPGQMRPSGMRGVLPKTGAGQREEKAQDRIEVTETHP